MSETPTPSWGIRVEQNEAGNEYTDGVDRLQTRLLHIGLFLLTVVMLGGGAGVLMVVTEESRAVTVSVAVVAGCVIAVLLALVAAMSATRQLTPRLRAPGPVAAPAPPPRSPEPVATQQPQATPLWSQQQVTITDDPAQRREVFVKLARRLQSLINRAIKRIDELEQENEDPELLDGLYEIDHLFTLARRQGENLAVLGGEAPQRRSNKPVSVYAVLLAAVSEAEHYRQIAIVPVEDVEIHGHAVAEIIHLLAELLENATRFTSPDGPKVEVRAQRVRAGLAIEVQDRGLGMSYEDLDRINHLLDGSTHIDLSELLSDGRIGLAVVRELARRHDIRVRLQSNIFGGIAAAVVIPPQLLSEPERESRHRAQAARQSALPRRRTEAALEPASPQVPALTAVALSDNSVRQTPSPGATRSTPGTRPVPAPSGAASEPGTQSPAATASQEPGNHFAATPNPTHPTSFPAGNPSHTGEPASEGWTHAAGPNPSHAGEPATSGNWTPTSGSNPSHPGEPAAGRSVSAASVSHPAESGGTQSPAASRSVSAPSTSHTSEPGGIQSSAGGRSVSAASTGHTSEPGAVQSPTAAGVVRGQESGAARSTAGHAAEPAGTQSAAAVSSTRAAEPRAGRSSAGTPESAGGSVPSVSSAAAEPFTGPPSVPIPVPAPLPIPTTNVATSSSAGLRPGRRHRVEAEDELPVLPVRAPGRSYDDLRAGGNGVVTAADEPPPLPQRRGSHLREELLEPPSPTKPVPGHNTSLMKTFQAGRDNWYAEQNREADTNRGDAWPTT